MSILVCSPRLKNGKCCYQIVDHLKGRFLHFHKILVLLERCSTIYRIAGIFRGYKISEVPLERFSRI